MEAQNQNKTRAERVADRAFEIYQKRGRDDGRHLDDWLEAERQVTAEDESHDGRVPVSSDRAAIDGTTPEDRDRASTVPRRGSKRQKRTDTL